MVSNPSVPSPDRAAMTAGELAPETKQPLRDGIGKRAIARQLGVSGPLLSGCGFQKALLSTRTGFLYTVRLVAIYDLGFSDDMAPSARSHEMTSWCLLRTAESRGVSWSCPTQFKSAPCARR